MFWRSSAVTLFCFSSFIRSTRTGTGQSVSLIGPCFVDKCTDQDLMGVSVVLQVVCTRLTPAGVRTSFTILDPGSPSDRRPAAPPRCLPHNPEPRRWPPTVTTATTRTVPSFSPTCPAPGTETTSPWHLKPSSSPSSSRSGSFNCLLTQELVQGWSRTGPGLVQNWYKLSFHG